MVTQSKEKGGVIEKVIEKDDSSKDLEIEDLNKLTLKNETCQTENCQCKTATKRVNQSASISGLFGPPKMMKHSTDEVSKSQSSFNFKEISPPTFISSPISPKLISKPTRACNKSFNLKELTLDFKSLATNEQPPPLSSSNDLFLFTASGSKDIHSSKQKKNKKHKNISKAKSNKPSHLFSISSESDDDSDEEISEGFKKFNFSAKSPTNLHSSPTNPPSTTTTLTSSCSREALVGGDGGGLVGGEDDWSMVELESYFENLCHIPRKMSAMAKMMYM